MFDWLNNFVPPKDQVELLERSLEFARDEQRWCTGALIQSAEKPIDGTTPVEKFAKQHSDAELCTNVQACAMGILVIASGNGQAIRAWIEEAGSEKQTFAYINELVGLPFEQATKTLAIAFGANDRFHSNFDTAVDFVENSNDEEDKFTSYDRKVYQYDRAAHHRHIVKVFEKSVELARDQNASQSTEA